ncbi:MAG: pirin-like C-terminal cupin domain-containing protein, partial [Myxococcota bacterium]|nr:pirin-like C-terminal cupin domain-containing protein [Myxococcota bacterium]
ITPGAVNWMTAGRGIVHSERTPEALRSAGSSLHGLQVWLALPRDAQEIEPSFVHHPADTLPRIVAPGLNLALIAGSAYGQTSPVETASPTFYLAGGLAAGTDLEPPGEHEERALYVVSGRVEIDGESVGAGSMAVLRNGSSPKLHASEDSQLALLGGAPLDGERHLWWNFVSTSKERIEQAKADWEGGRFPVVPGDTESIPLPKS